MKKTFLYLNSIFIVVGILFLSYLAFIDGVVLNKPITYNGNVFTTDKQIYYVGDTVKVNIQFCKMRNLEGTVQWALVDTYIYYMPQIKSNVPVGCYTDKYFDAGFITKAIVPGKYHFEGVRKFEVNPLRTVYYNYKTTDFEIR